MLPDRGNAYTGTKASYVALSAVTVLALALLCSIWTTDVSGSVALLGLFAVYMASQELLVLFMVFIPASILVDLVRGLGGPAGGSGRGWLIFLQLLELAAKVAGGFFAFTLYKSVSSGDYGNPSSYSAPPPPPSVPIPGTTAYQRVQDPFSGTPAYSPLVSQMSPAGGEPHSAPVSRPQPQQAQQQQSQTRPQQPPPPPPAAPQFDLV